MKVSEAIELLKLCDPNNELVISRPNRGGIGVPAHDKIKDRSVTDGFDWGKGYTFIHVDNGRPDVPPPPPVKPVS